MLQSMTLEDFTVFHDAEFTFGRHLNVIVGENGAGKSQPQAELARKFQAVFRPDGLRRLVRRQKGRRKCTLELQFAESAHNLQFTFSTVAKSEVTLRKTPKQRTEKRPVFLPTRELLAIYGNNGCAARIFIALPVSTVISAHRVRKSPVLAAGN